MEFDSKVTIDIGCFSERIAPEAVPPAAILLGTRTTGIRPGIKPVPRRAAFRHAWSNSIIGIGLYQGMEFIMQKSFGEMILDSRIIFSRAYNNMNLIRKAKVYEFLIGRGRAGNYEVLREFIQGV